MGTPVREEQATQGKEQSAKAELQAERRAGPGAGEPRWETVGFNPSPRLAGRRSA